jgi:hypothetical protein
MIANVFQQYRLEAVAMGLVTKTKTGIARVLAPVPFQSQTNQDVLFGQANTPREEGQDNNEQQQGGLGAKEGPIEENGIIANSRTALETFVRICNSDEPGADEKQLAQIRLRDPTTTAVLEAIVANYATEVSVNASPNEAQEEDVLHEAFASEEDWLDDGPNGAQQQGNNNNNNNGGGQQQQQQQGGSPAAGDDAGMMDQ